MKWRQNMVSQQAPMELNQSAELIFFGPPRPLSPTFCSPPPLRSLIRVRILPRCRSIRAFNVEFTGDLEAASGSGGRGTISKSNVAAGVRGSQTHVMELRGVEVRPRLGRVVLPPPQSLVFGLFAVSCQSRRRREVADKLFQVRSECTLRWAEARRW